MSGAVRQGLPVDGPAAPPIKLDFEAPKSGASPQEIVEGFLSAQWSSDDDYAAARAYLTPSASADWRPSTVVVYPDGSEPELRTAPGGRSVTVSAQEAGVLSASGRFQASPAGTTREMELPLEYSGGQWRIASLPEGFGAWLSEFYFDRAYRQFQVAYVGSRGKSLVPDWRRFQVGAGLATSLARAMLGPVPDYLSAAVLSGFPPGTTLTVEAVPVEDGTAEVDLNSRAVLDMGADRRRAAWAQALRVMRQVPGAEDVVLTADGKPLELSGFDTAPQRLADLGFEGPPSRSPVVVRRVGSVLTPLSSSSFPLEVDSPRLPTLPEVPERWEHVAVSLDLEDVLAVDAGRTTVQRWIRGVPVKASVPGTALTSPAFDSTGRAWLGGRDADGRGAVWAMPPEETASDGEAARPVDADWLADRDIVDVRSSPEAYRVVVISRDRKDGSQLVEVAGVVRAADGSPRALGEPLRVAGDVAEATSATWIDDRSLGMVGSKVRGGAHVPLVTDLSDTTQDYPDLEDVRSLVSLGSERGLVAVTDADVMVRRHGSGWQTLGGVTDVLVPAR